MTAREEIVSPGAAACVDEQAVPDSGTRAAAEAQGEKAKRHGGLDVLRILAVLLVTAQHALSLSDRDEWTTWRQINIGQLGVAIFLILSGLAAGQDHRPPVAWLARRLARIMPAYWLVIMISFGLTWASGYKPVSAAQFISQMAGTGLFTHPGALINSPTWFISLLLALYLALFCFRLTTVPCVAVLSALLLVTAGTATADSSLLFAHAMTFLIGASAALAARERDMRWALILAMLESAMLIVIKPQFVYPAASSMLIILCWYWRIHWRALTLLVDCSYEYYLVHGIALVGTLVALKMPFVPGVTIGILASGLVAIPLRRLSAAAAGLIDRAIGASYRGDLAVSRLRVLPG